MTIEPGSKGGEVGNKAEMRGRSVPAEGPVCASSAGEKKVRITGMENKRKLGTKQGWSAGIQLETVS